MDFAVNLRWSDYLDDILFSVESCAFTFGEKVFVFRSNNARRGIFLGRGDWEAKVVDGGRIVVWMVKDGDFHRILSWIYCCWCFVIICRKKNEEICCWTVKVGQIIVRLHGDAKTTAICGDKPTGNDNDGADQCGDEQHSSTNLGKGRRMNCKAIGAIIWLSK